MFAPAAFTTAALSSLRIGYSPMPLADALADPQLLAAFSFAPHAAPATADPRHLAIALPALGVAPLELWHVNDHVQSGERDGLRFSHGGGLQFCALALEDDGDIERVAAHAYARMHAWLAHSGYSHPLRIWNYLDAITEGEGDDERYRRFCVGRARGIGRNQHPHELPAATAIGHPQRSGCYQLYWLAAKTPGAPLENPRQVQAWRYPRKYGPQPPGFARALLPASPQMPLLLSGTAAVVGHASQHHDVQTQLQEVLTNLQALLDTARLQRPALAPTLAAQSPLKVYVRDAESLQSVDAQLQRLLPHPPRIVLHADVCRRDLLVEIDGCHV